jgi:anti-anti-sigma factor
MPNIMIIKTSEENGGIIFDVEGEMRRTDTPQTTLHSMVKSQLDRGRMNVLIDLGGVEFMDSFGVGEILASFTSIQNLGGQFKLCRISKKILMIFRITMLDKVLDIREDCSGALDSFDGA